MTSSPSTLQRVWNSLRATHRRNSEEWIRRMEGREPQRPWR